MEPQIRTLSIRIKKFVILFAFLGILLGVVMWGSARFLGLRTSTTQEFEPRIVNKTKALEIVSATRVLIGKEYTLEVTVKNLSDKSIGSYTYLAGDAWNTRSYAFGQSLFAPGATDIEYVPYENLRTSATNYPRREGELVFAAVWFEGASGDGDPDFVNKLSDEFAGLKQQARLILPLLRQASEAIESQGDQALTDLESRAARLSTGDDESSPSIEYKQGLSLAKSQLDSKVKEIRNQRTSGGAINQKAELAKYIAIFERLQSRF